MPVKQINTEKVQEEDSNHTYRLLQKENEQLKIQNIHLVKNYERERGLVEMKVRELEEF